MPIYEFKCANCGNVDEHLMRVSDPAPEGCTKCGGPVSKVLSQTSFALKGDGWYVTDYKPKPKGAEGGSAAASEAESGDGAGASKETPAGAESAPAAPSSPSEPASSGTAGATKTGADA